MERRIGQVDMVRWQGRRLAAEDRAKGRVLRTILAIAALSALSLMVGFYSGLPVPIGLLQTVFVVLTVAFAVFGARIGLEAMKHRGEHRRVYGRRR